MGELIGVLASDGPPTDVGGALWIVRHLDRFVSYTVLVSWLAKILETPSGRSGRHQNQEPAKGAKRRVELKRQKTSRSIVS